MAYYVVNGGRLACAKTHAPARGADRHIASATLAHVRSVDFPCVMAQTALNTGGISVGVYRSFDDPTSLDQLSTDLLAWQSTRPHQTPTSFLAMFQEDQPPHARAFHDGLWRALGGLRARSAPSLTPPGVSDHIEDDDFALVLHGEAYFVVGLSPQSGRLSRRTAYCGFALNPHSQFETLRSEGRMARLQELSRQRDMRLQGSINSLLADHGARSAALQYSGCPMADWPDWPARPRD